MYKVTLKTEGVTTFLVIRKELLTILLGQITPMKSKYGLVITLETI